MGMTRSEMFEQWLAEHRGLVIKVVRSFTANAAGSEDLFQEIAVAIVLSLEGYKYAEISQIKGLSTSRHA